MKYLQFLKNPKKYLDNRANTIARGILNQQNNIPISETWDEDIFIAGYPKSGNTWLQNLISSIILETTSQNLNQSLVNELIPNLHGRSYYKRVYPIMFFKTHDLPKKEYKKVIFLIRDGRDAMISYYNMEINQNKDYPYTLEEMIVKGKGIFPSKWHTHTKMWTKNPFNAKILTIKYEDLKVNPKQELKKICVFSKISISDELLEEIIEANNIDNLRKKAKKFGLENDDKFKEKNSSDFFRKGKVGSFKEEMDEELVRFFNDEASEELKLYNYKF